MNGPTTPAWQKLYTTPLDAQEREKLALRALRCILEEKLLPLHSLEQTALQSILQSVERRVR
jgi:hypothetical protein